MGHASRKSRTAQLVAHPAFPLVIALWFAALIGLGSLLVPSALVERIVVAIGLPGIISAAAPPLGMTAKIAIALVGGVFGAALGLLLGRQVYRASREQASAVSPINAHEELGADGLDGADERAELAEQEAALPEEPPVETADAEDDMTEVLLDTGSGEPETDLPEKLAEELDGESDGELDQDEAWDLAWLEEDETPEPDTIPEDAREAQPDAETPDVETPDAEPLAPAPEIAREDEPVTPNSELEELSLMQLAQRLQSAIVARRTMRAAAPVAAIAVPEDDADDAAEEASEAEATLEDEAVIEDEPVAAPEVVAPTPEPEPDLAPEAAPDPDAEQNPEASAIHHPAHKPFLEAADLMAQDDGEDFEDETALGETYTSLLAMTASVRAQPEEAPEEQSDETGDDLAHDVEEKGDKAPAGTLASLDRPATGDAPAREIDPEAQALRDALMNLQHFTKTS